MTKEQLNYFITLLEAEKTDGKIPLNTPITNLFPMDISSIDYTTDKINFLIKYNKDIARDKEFLYDITFDFKKQSFTYEKIEQTWNYECNSFTEGWNFSEKCLKKETLPLSKEEVDALYNTLHTPQQLEYHKQIIVRKQEQELRKERKKTEPEKVLVEDYEKYLETTHLLDKNEQMIKALNKAFTNNREYFSFPTFCKVENGKVTLYKLNNPGPDYYKKDNVHYMKQEHVPYLTFNADHPDFQNSEPIYLTLNSRNSLDKEHYTFEREQITYNSPVLYMTTAPYDINFDETFQMTRVSLDVNLKESVNDWLINEYTDLNQFINRSFNLDEEYIYRELEKEDEDITLIVNYSPDMISVDLQIDFKFYPDTLDSDYESVSYFKEDISLPEEEIKIICEKIAKMYNMKQHYLEHTQNELER